MKRSGLGRRSPLKRGTKGLARQRVPLVVKARRVIDRQASEAWAKRARGQVCAMCGKGSKQRVACRGHHALYRAKLREWAQRAGLEFSRLEWDLRNLVALCDDCHERHHSGARPIPWALVAKAAPKLTRFAAEIDRAFEAGQAPAAAFLERTYL